MDTRRRMSLLFSIMVLLFLAALNPPACWRFQAMRGRRAGVQWLPLHAAGTQPCRPQVQTDRLR